MILVTIKPVPVHHSRLSWIVTALHSCPHPAVAFTTDLICPEPPPRTSDLPRLLFTILEPLSDNRRAESDCRSALVVTRGFPPTVALVYFYYTRCGVFLIRTRSSFAVVTDGVPEKALGGGQKADVASSAVRDEKPFHWLTRI